MRRWSLEDEEEAYFEAKKWGVFGETEDDADDTELGEIEEERGEEIAADTKATRKISARAETHPLKAPCHHERQRKWSDGRQYSNVSSSPVLPLLLPSLSKISNIFLKSLFCSGEESGPENDAEDAAVKPKAS